MDLAIVENTRNADQCVFALSGKINAASALELKHRIKEVVGTGRIKVVLDMEGVDFMDSSGLSALIAGLKCAREAGGSLRLARLQDQAATVLRLMMLDRVFEIYPSPADALKA